MIKLYGFEFAGPLPLDVRNLAVVPVGGFGVYSLGRRTGNLFAPGYFGRSDTCLKTRIGKHVRAGGHPHFCFRPLASLWEAYSHECKLVHAFWDAFPLTNKNHPAKPVGMSWTCPVCGQ